MKTRNSFIYVLAIALMFAFIGCTNPSTPAGHEGYVKESPRIWGNGGYQGTNVGPQNFGLAIWNNKVENVDFRPRTYAEPFSILAKDELNVGLDFQTIISIRAGTIKEVVEVYSGAAFYKRFVKEPLRSMIRSNVQILNSMDIKVKRKIIAASVKSELEEYLDGTPFIVKTCVVGNIKYPDIVTNAVEIKMAETQRLAKKDIEKDIAIKDAEIALEEAKGIAAAQKEIDKTLTPQYLQFLAIKAQLTMASSPNHTTVYIPSGANGIPIVKTIR